VFRAFGGYGDFAAIASGQVTHFTVSALHMLSNFSPHSIRRMASSVCIPLNQATPVAVRVQAIQIQMQEFDRFAIRRAAYS